MNIREEINQVILEERVIAEANNVTVDTFMGSPQRNDSGDLNDKVEKLTINVGNKNNLIDKVANLKINARNENYLIDKLANMTINDVRNDLNRSNASEVQVQFVDDRDGKTHQDLLSSRMVKIRHE